jgi:hypothetical protein
MPLLRVLASSLRQFHRDQRVNDFWEGIYHFSSSDDAISGGKGRYEGTFRGLLPDGVGTCVYLDGGRYSGDWTQGRYNGQGSLLRGCVGSVWSVCGVWVGEVASGCRVGPFVLLPDSPLAPHVPAVALPLPSAALMGRPQPCRDGSSYNGAWKMGLRHGFGVDDKPSTNER